MSTHFDHDMIKNVLSSVCVLNDSYEFVCTWMLLLRTAAKEWLNVDCSPVGGVHETIQNRDNDATQPIENIGWNVSLKNISSVSQILLLDQYWKFLSVWILVINPYFWNNFCIGIYLNNDGCREGADEVHDQDGDDDEGHDDLPVVLLLLLVDVLEVMPVQTLLCLDHTHIDTVPPRNL